jgi:RNA polymerase sigma-70 factor, ECF subfamily
MIHPLPANTANETAASAGLVPNEEHTFELIYRQMRALVGPRDVDFDDLVQDALEQALRSQASFEGRSKFSTWTYQICHRTVLKRRRWYGRWLRRFTLTAAGDLPEAPPADSEAVSAGLPGHLREQSERAGRLWAALSALSPKKRVVVVLHDLEELPCEDIAQVIDTKLGTVRSRLRDGRRELLQLLKQDPFFGEEVSP